MTDDTLFGEPCEKDWDYKVTGTYGAFESVSGPVDYVMTTARLSKFDNDDSVKLTNQLRPVREILDTKTMDFDHLLQRDLDDYRVSTELIPYLLQKSSLGPAFFPPIVAAILPFKGPNQIPSFPKMSPIDAHKKYGTFWKGVSYGDYFSFEKMVKQNGDYLPMFKNAQLSWNEKKAKVVVLDGQHRAMALIAVHRTINKIWGETAGAKYKHFYENSINKSIKMLGDDWIKDHLENIEFPVIICNFRGDGIDQQKSARKLFIDVNKNARRPSESRLILLSDESLINIFTRNTLNTVRKSKDINFPIYAIEYDYPGNENNKSVTTPIKWSALINIEILREMIKRCVFGPENYITDLSVKVGGKKPNWTSKNRFMRKQLELSKWLPEEFCSGTKIYNRSDIKVNDFPHEKIKDFTKKYQESWGDALLILFSKFLPFSKHIEALDRLDNKWSDANTIGSLSKESIFSGVGMYWTLKESFEVLNEVENDTENEIDDKELPDISEAWKEIQRQEKKFYNIRSKIYYGKDDPDNKKTKAFYNKIRTYACTVGGTLAFASLTQLNDISPEKLTICAHDFINCINESLECEDGKRKLIFSTDTTKPLNRIVKMDKNHATFFRYFWFELLMLNIDKDIFPEWIDKSDFKIQIGQLRKVYYNYLLNESINSLNSNVAPEERNSHSIINQAKKITKTGLKKSLCHWFEYTDTRFEAWLTDEDLC